MRFTAKFAIPIVDEKKYRLRMHEFCLEAVKEAARVWLETVVPEVHVKTAASKATFKKLSDEVDFQLGSLSPRSGEVSRVPLGIAESEGEIIIDRKNGIYMFWYSTSLNHLVAHIAQLPGWNLTYELKMRGEAALQQYLDEIAANVPDPIVETRFMNVG